MLKDQRGGVTLDAVTAILLLTILALGVVEVAMGLYARNIVASAAHEAAREAVMLDGDSSTASHRARRFVRQTAGGLVTAVDVNIASPVADGSVRVSFAARVRIPGPIPLDVPMTFIAHAFREGMPR